MDRNVLILRSIHENRKITQRELCRLCGASLGTVNGAIRRMQEDGLLEKDASGEYTVTEKGYEYLKPYKMQKAVILAAGFGSRFVPLTLETPKGLLEVFGEPMIERQIRQLFEAGIRDITVIVGYRKEKFEYLIDKFGVKLLYNPEYSGKNTLASLYCARDELFGSNAYILSSDNWMRENLYHEYEPCAWYAAAHSDGPTSEWVLETDSRGRITDTYPGGRDCDYMYGPVCFSRHFSEQFLPVLSLYYQMPGTEDCYWENVLMELYNGSAGKRLNAYYGKTKLVSGLRRPEMYINRQEKNIIYEFENLEELRKFDPKYVNDSGSSAMQLVSRVFGVPESEIVKIRCMKSGMTNSSWLFELKGESYICRIPGEGTEKLINRKQEEEVCRLVSAQGISEEICYFDPETGYKISKYYENSRVANPADPGDMKQCMEFLRRFHERNCTVSHDFDLAERIRYYENLICEKAFGENRTEEKRSPEEEEKELFSAVPFRDYPEIRRQKDRLLSLLAEKKRPRILCHIDSVSDNFLFIRENGKEDVRLIDWEYAGMADPLTDIGMCAIYSFMQEEKMKELASFYFGREPGEEEMMLIRAYAALGGLLWSLWGVYKELCGVPFTDYTLKMYRYFKNYAPAAIRYLEK